MKRIFTQGIFVVLLVSSQACTMRYADVRLASEQPGHVPACYAVAPLDNLSMTTNAGVQMAYMLSGALRASGAQVLDPNEMLRFSEMRKVDLTDLDDPELLRTLHKDWGIDVLVRGTVKEYWYTDDPDIYSDKLPAVAFRYELIHTADGSILFEADSAGSDSGFTPGIVTLGAVSLAAVDRTLALWTDSWGAVKQPQDVRCGFQTADFTRGLVGTPVVQEVASTAARQEAAPAVDAAPREPLSEKAQELVSALRTQARSMFRGVRFVYKQSVFAEGSRPVLEAFGEVLRRYPDLRLRMWVHTDNQGDADENIRLSREQGNAVLAFLRDMAQVDTSRIRLHTVGGEEPILPNINRRNRMINRRIELQAISVPAGGW